MYTLWRNSIVVYTHSTTHTDNNPFFIFHFNHFFMATKRLRGWALQKELVTENPCKRGESLTSSKQPSQLANKLLSLWAHGTLSAIMVQEIAHLAMLDGASHHDLLAISETGHFGEYPGNVHRDSMQEFAHHLCIDAHKVVTSYVDPKSSSLEEGTVDILLPHMLFSNLAKGYPSRFEELFVAQNLKDFWKMLLEKRMKG
jgi:hypothetical protein